eukprot:COSAG01_NODE_12962_length_1656_cov_2.761079_2_plen_75_part_00
MASLPTQITHIAVPVEPTQKTQARTLARTHVGNEVQHEGHQPEDGAEGPGGGAPATMWLLLMRRAAPNADTAAG